MAVPRLEASKDCDMKKKLLVLIIAVIPTMMPNLASAIALSSCENDLECFGDNCWCGQGNGDF